MITLGQTKSREEKDTDVYIIDVSADVPQNETIQSLSVYLDEAFVPLFPDSGTPDIMQTRAW
jgi:hypothetical protein